MLTLEEIYELDPNTIESLLLINDFVSILIPVFHYPSYRIEKEDTIESLYERFKNREIGGWCGLFTSYMSMLLDKCGIPAYVYNYGLYDTEFTHTVMIVNGYLLDPYFNKYYVDKKGRLIKFGILLQMIDNRDFSFSKVYSLSVKTKRNGKERYEFISLTGQKWEESLLSSWKHKSFFEIMKSEFGDINPDLLMLYNIKEIKY